jgi:hypothetical protein
MESIIKATASVATKMFNVKKEVSERRFEHKEDFNFFSAITSGKYTKHHIEKYHSNLIAYLLDPCATHGFGRFFLNKFCSEVLEGKCSISFDRLPKVERERPALGRSIDISIEIPKKFILFIENKIWSGEGVDQMKDYFSFAKQNFKGGIGIYLTLNDTEPISIQQREVPDNFKLVSVPYRKIVNWVDKCCSSKEVSGYSHVTSALQQYVDIVNQLLNQRTEIMNKFDQILNAQKEDTEAILRNRQDLLQSTKELAIDVTDKFVRCLQTKVSATGLEPFQITIHPGSYIDEGGEQYGLGFTVRHPLLAPDGDFNYGGEGYGGSGNGIWLNKVDAHNEIDEANAVLFNASKETEKWKALVNTSLCEILREIIENVIPEAKCRWKALAAEKKNAKNVSAKEVDFEKTAELPDIEMTILRRIQELDILSEKLNSKITESES